MSNAKIFSHAKILYLVQLALLTSVLIVMNFTPLGFLKLGLVQISFMSIPVIIGGAVLGPFAGAFLGFIFGACSFALAPTDPLFGVAFASNPFIVAIVCFIPRILIGLVAAYIVKLFEKINRFKKLSYFAAGLFGALTNTVFFLAGVILLLEKLITPKMIEFNLLAVKTFTGFWVSIGVGNGIPEAIVSTIISGTIIIALKAYFPKKIK